MSSLSLSQNASPTSNILSSELGEESVLLNLQTEEYFGLDDIGTRMWQMLIEKDSIQAAIDALLVEYKVEPNQLQQDIKNLVEELVDHGLLELSGS